MFLHVETAEYVRHPVLALEFTDGSARQVDLSAELYGEVFEPLRDPESSGR